MHILFYRLYRFVQEYKWPAICIAVIFLLLLGWIASGIRFEEDITRIIPKSEQGNITTRVVKQLNFSDKITVLIEKDENGSAEDMTSMANAFLEAVREDTQNIRSIQGRMGEEDLKETFDFISHHLPLLMEGKDYTSIAAGIQADSIAKKVEQNYKTLISPTGLIARDFILNDPLGLSFLPLKRLQEMNVGAEFLMKDGFIVTKDESLLLLFINPVQSGTETERNTVFVQELKRTKKELNQRFSGKARIDFFGASLIAVANAQQIKTDILTTILVSMGTLMLLLILYFKRIYIPLIIFVPSVFGALFALACMFFIRTTISAISLSIGAVLLGVTIDYSLHILTHYKHNSNVKELFKDIVRPVIMSSATTAIAFLCLLFVNSEALRDLGIFASISVMMSAVFSLIFIPHLYRPKEGERIKGRSLLDILSRFAFEKNKVLIIGSILLVVGSLFFINKVNFNNDLSHLNYIPKHLADLERKLESSTNLTSKSIYLVVHGSTMEEALDKNHHLYEQLIRDKERGAIINFSSVGGLLLSKQDREEKLQQWKQFWNKDNRKSHLQAQLIASGNQFGFNRNTHQRFYELLDSPSFALAKGADASLPGLLTDEFIAHKNGLYTVTSIVKLKESDRDAYIGTLNRINKDVVVIDRKQLNETYLGHLKDDFNSLVNYSFIAIILILLYFFRRFELVLLSMVPIVLTGLVTIGLMGIFNIQFNIFSLIVCTLVFGHGVDFTIFMTSALQKEYTYGTEEVSTYRTSILLAVLTTILAIGALIFAKHPALRSISTVSLIGVFSALFITFIIYPILFKLCITSRPQKNRSPVTLRLFVHSILSFAYYGIGSLLFSVLGLLFLLVPVNKEKKMSMFRKIVAFFSGSVLYTNPFVKKKVINEHKETLERPAVIISNHSSFLDNLVLSMLSYRIIFFVNDWVYNSRIFGTVVRVAGHYPVSKGLEGSIEHLKPKLEEGYSLMTFPEGTRSVDNDIRRFHKGAFYMAEQLGLDILPVYIHGNAEVLPKGDYIIYNGSETVVIGKRIKADDTTFGSNYRERTRSISKLFKTRYAEIRKQLEHEDYFKHKLLLSYLYKEEEVIRSIKKDFRKYKRTYHILNSRIAPDAGVLHISNDYGQLDALLVLQQAGRKVYSYIRDEDKRNAAVMNYICRQRKVHYLSAPGNLRDEADTLLFSADFSLDYEMIPDTAVQVIIIDKLGSGTAQIPGFQLDYQRESLMVFKKNDATKSDI